ncbi:MAG: transcriptional regulator [Candidatus Rokuibacteriota bacterium]|nr:MAG: transcriptional regulator [Candidatus Rokubacteria bacterium]
MLRFTKRADYGLMAIHYIAVHDELGAVSAKRIAEEFAIPPELLAKILQRLAKRRLIVSQNGPKGGYVLTRHPNDISVGEVVRALEGPISIVSCLDHSGCPQEQRCNLRRPVQKLQSSISRLLDTMSLAELTNQDTPEVVSIK